jgi:cell wall-associated NlpC family hydrolase
MPPANDSATPAANRVVASAEGSPLMTTRIRIALIFLTVLACVAARAGGALGAHMKVSLATRTAQRQALVVRFARRFIGVRYVYGGTSPRYGFDCSGFTRFVYAHFGISLPHYSGAQFDMGRRVSRQGLRPGDLVFFDGLGHVGLYVGNGRFIHAPHTGTRVQISPLAGWYSARYDGARRLV